MAEASGCHNQRSEFEPAPYHEERESWHFCMKIYRLIGIITTLQQQKTVTAPYLAEKFEVSRRTINRDIEDICRAGIPLVTTQGAGGGISIMEGFSLDTTVFTKQELAAILTGLKSLDSISRSDAGENLARKIGGGPSVRIADHMTIDLASHYKDDLASKLELIKSAIETSRCIAFRYYYEKGEADKLIEPCQIVFKWYDWYVFGFCRQRRDFRLYKLRRLWSLEVTRETFAPREIPEEKRNFGSHMTDDYMVAAVYDPGVRYRLVEEYGPDCYTEQEDGRLYAEWGFTTPQRAVEWFLGFGGRVKVLHPPEMVERMRETLDAARNLYGT